MLVQALKVVMLSLAGAAAAYAALLLLLTTTFFQTHAVYLHAFQMTGSKDLNTPEMFGFLRGQVASFHIPAQSGALLHGWHILPIGIYHRVEEELLKQPTGLAPDITSTTGFELLRSDPNALLVIHFHGAGGNVGSGYRVPNYKALSAAQPDKVHVLTFDYRGFGLSQGTPNESGVIQDALSVVEWALNIARIPPTRILIFSQSLGTAVNMAVAEHYASVPKPVIFAGHILVAPFVNVPRLVATYRIAGTVPILSPVAKYPVLFNWLKSYIQDSWSTDKRIQKYVRLVESTGKRYRISILHAEDDYDIPHTHTPELFDLAVNAASENGLSPEHLARRRLELQRDLGPAGTVTKWETENGIIEERILKYGLHDVIMGDPTITLTAIQIFDHITNQ